LYEWDCSHVLPGERRGCHPTLPTRKIFAQLHYGDSLEAAGTLLGSISSFCQHTGMAESTFGRRAVNDGKFVARLRDGARVTPETLTRVNEFIAKNGGQSAGEAPPELMPLIHAGAPQRAPAPAQKADPETNFRFFD